MAESLLALKNRIQTVQSIKKITKAMKLIASSRYTKLKSLYDGNLAYTNALKDAMKLCLTYVNYDSYKLPTCMQSYPGNKKLYIFITPTLGLCGSYYYNLEKLASKIITKDDDVVFIGERGYKHFKNLVHHAYSDYINLLDNLTFDYVNSFRHYLDAIYKKEKYNSISVIYTKFLSSMSTQTVCENLFPLKAEKLDNNEKTVEPIFEGNPQGVADLIVPHYLDALLYHLMLESSISEQTCRKNSMENATSSADKLIYDLKLLYNHVRQEKITNEITEIISGSGDSLNFI